MRVVRTQDLHISGEGLPFAVITGAVLALRYAAHLIGQGDRPPVARPMPSAGFWPQAPAEDARPNAVIIFYRALVAGGDHNPQMRQRMHRLLAIVSKWSMMDVLIVAIVIVAAKTSGFADAFTQPGLWYYVISVAAAAIATYMVRD